MSDQHSPQSNQINFGVRPHEFIVCAYDEGALFIDGWTVSIGLPDLKEYIADFEKDRTKDPNAGFFEMDQFIALSHKGAKLAMKPEEAEAAIKFLKNFYKI